MSNENDFLVISELRYRIENLKNIINSGPFFREVARLVGWIRETSLFEQPLFSLELQSKKRDRESLEILREIHSEGKNMWLTIKKISILLEKTPEVIRHSLAMLHQYYEMAHPQYGIGIYHSLRYVIEHLALSEDSKKVEKFIDRNNDAKYPNLKGKISDLFISFNKKQDVIKKELVTSLWGAWDNLKYVNYLASIDNDYPQLEDWAKVFTKDEYFIHLYKVSDYFFDWLILDKKKDRSNADPLSEFAVWDKEFRLEKNYAKFGQYGEVRFYPERSPSRLENEKGPTSTIKILEKLFDVGAKGLEKKGLLEDVKFTERDISPLMSNINTVFYNASKNQKIKAQIYVTEENGLFRLLVIPLEYEPDKPTPEA